MHTANYQVIFTWMNCVKGIVILAFQKPKTCVCQLHCTLYAFFLSVKSKMGMDNDFFYCKMGITICQPGESQERKALESVVKLNSSWPVNINTKRIRIKFPSPACIHYSNSATCY